MKISLIILAYNDGQSLLEHIPGWLAVLEQTPAYELIISDDGSSDNTAQIAESFMQQNPNVKYIRSEKNCGVGANFRMGLQVAKGDVIAYTDGDGQYLPSDLLDLASRLGDSDMVTGRRVKRADPFLRSITSFIYNNLVRFIYHIPVRDINSGLKIFTRRYLESCTPQFSRGPFYDAEYIIKGYKKGMHIKETPIAHRPRKYGTASGISFRSVSLLFGEVCKHHMKPYTRNNYFSRLIFRLLAS